MNIATKLFDLSGDWVEEIQKPLHSRDGFRNETTCLEYTQIAGAVLGAPRDAFSYQETLFSLAYEYDNVHVLQSGGFQKEMCNDRRVGVQELLAMNKQAPLSANRLLAFIQGKNLLPFRGEPFYNHYTKAYIKMIETLKAKEGENGRVFDRVLMDSVKWLWNHVVEWQERPRADSVPVSIVWYGNATKSETYFLTLLMGFGFDVIAMNPEGENIFAQINFDTPLQKNPNTLPFEPIPTEKPRQTSTIARRASAEIEQIMSNEGVPMFKPWQYRDAATLSIRLHTTFEEVRIITQAAAFLRPGFEVKEMGATVTIPVLFTKICGIMKDRKAFAELYQEIVEYDLALVNEGYPINRESRASRTTAINRNSMHVKQCMGGNGKIDPAKVMTLPWWNKFSRLPMGLQIALASAIARSATSGKLQADRPGDVKNPHEGEITFLAAESLGDDPALMRVIQLFDYPQRVPRIVIFCDGNDYGELSPIFVSSLLIMGEFGFDIIIINPSGQNCIEQYLNEKFIDKHWLEDKCFDETHETLLKRARSNGGLLGRKKNLIQRVFGG